MRQSRLVALAALLGISAVMGFQFCPPTGPLLPNLKQSTSDLFDLAPLGHTLNSLINDPAAPFNTSTSSFSLTITTKDETIFQYHHTAPNTNKTGVQKVDGDSVYRIASVSKIFTVLSLMVQEGMNLDDYIWKFVPQLAGHQDFQETTLKMIASHLSGFLRDGMPFDYKTNVPKEALIGLGLPIVEYPSDYAVCSAMGFPDCSRDEFLSDVSKGELIWLPGQTPTYSNYAFSILAFAAENFTGKAWNDIVVDNVIKPLDLTSTGFFTPKANTMVIPTGDGHRWASLDFSHWKGTAGIYSTPNDLGRFLRGAIGMPWQIIRPINIQRASSSRPLEIYAMSGGISNYASYVAIIPEYKVGVTINVAGTGDDTATRSLLDLAVQHLIPMVDDLVRKQATKFTGTYVSKSYKGSSLTLALDSGPGLKISEWTTRGTPFFDIWSAFTAVYPILDARIYPVGQGNRWQGGFQGVPKYEETGIFKGSCATWFDFGRSRYAGKLFDEFTFILDSAGKVTGVKIQGFREELTKVQEKEE